MATDFFAVPAPAFYVVITELLLIFRNISFCWLKLRSFKFIL